jgi:hypothetical protein
MSRGTPNRRVVLFALICAAVMAALTGHRAFAQQTAFAQQNAFAQQTASPAPRTPRTAAPVDLTGNWVSVVTEDWLWRMRTPRKGDYTSIPLSDEGRRVADQWDPSTDGSCKAFGAGGLMRIPTRLRITWRGDDTLSVETDAGQQTRLMRFDRAQAAGPRSLQGHSIAEWEPIGGPPVMRDGRPVAGGTPQGGSLKVVTTNLAEGWLRKNGVAYSESASLLEYWDRVAFPNGDTWLIVTSVVSDPRYLMNDYTTSTHFKREADGSKWKATPCRS